MIDKELNPEEILAWWNENPQWASVNDCYNQAVKDIETIAQWWKEGSMAKFR